MAGARERLLSSVQGRSISLFVAGLSLTLVASCGGGGGSPGTGSSAAVKRTIGGAIHGGQSPICNSTVTLYGAGLPGNCGTTTSGSDGSFTLDTSGCTAGPTTQMYIVATGGVPNTNACDGSNTAIALSSALGPFGDFGPSTSVNITEVTTVASVWALNQFLDSSGKVLSSPLENQVGLTNAVNAVTSQNLVDIRKGSAPASFGPGVISPTSKMYTLANMLAACVNTSSSSSLLCRALMCLAPPGSSFDDSSGICTSAPGHPPSGTTLEAAVT